MQEANIYGLWVGKQTARGTKNAAPAKRLVQVGGDFAVNRDDGSEPFSDLTKYGDRTDWINNLTGAGEPGIETTPTELAYLLWLFHGAETVTAVPGPPASSHHAFVPSSGRGFWSTFVRRMGQTVITRHSYNDGLIGRIQIEGSTANKAVRITPRVMSLDPAEVIAADPAAAMPTDDPFRYTDGTGTFTLDTVVQAGQSQFTFVADEDLSPQYGDDVVAYDLSQGTPTATIAATVLHDAVSLARWNTLVYGTAAPAPGTKPVKTLPALGSYSFNLQQRDAAGALNGRRFVLTAPGVKWAIPDAPAPNPEGGSVELAFAGELRPVAGQPLYTIDVYTDPAVVAFTV